MNEHVGSTSSHPEVEPTVSSQEAESEAVAIIMRRLNASPRTRAELTRSLRDKGISESSAERALDRVAEMGYIDDAEFAHAWVKSRMRSRGLAPSVLRRELSSKGVDRELIDVALAEIAPEESRERAYQLAEKKFRSLNSVAPTVAISRISSLLQRKGYGPSEAFAIARDVVGEADIEYDLD